MDWIGQLDNLTKVIVIVIVGLGVAVASLVFTNNEKDSTIRWRDSTIASLRAQLETVTAERNELWQNLDELMAELDAHDPAGPARRLIEELRRRRAAREVDEWS